jgi:PhzF family phenazine biosynthesis protein
MKQLPIYQVDAFTSKLFGGNPAAVCILEDWQDETMQLIAAENNLSETAFIIPDGKYYHIRWFTPDTEVDLCGHATLASAFIIYEKLKHEQKTIYFKSKSGELSVVKNDHLLSMNFPALSYQKKYLQENLLQSIGVQPTEIYESKFDLLLICKNEKEVMEAHVNLKEIAKLKYRGVILSATAQNADIYSRCFYPACGVPEDPVTGSAHCVLAPYWCSRLNKEEIHAVQGYQRRGELWCKVINNRVVISGFCQLYLEGRILI